MTNITLSDEQAEVLSSASLPIVLVDSRGRKLGEVSKLNSDQGDSQATDDQQWIAKNLRRLEESRSYKGKLPTTREVLARLRAIKPE